MQGLSNLQPKECIAMAGGLIILAWLAGQHNLTVEDLSRIIPFDRTSDTVNKANTSSTTVGPNDKTNINKFAT